VISHIRADRKGNGGDELSIGSHQMTLNRPQVIRRASETWSDALSDGLRVA